MHVRMKLKEIVLLYFGLLTPGKLKRTKELQVIFAVGETLSPCLNFLSS